MAGLYLPLLITSGEPAGIGMDIILSLAASNRLTIKVAGWWYWQICRRLQQRYKQLKEQQILTNVIDFYSVSIATVSEQSPLSSRLIDKPNTMNVVDMPSACAVS